MHKILEQKIQEQFGGIDKLPSGVEAVLDVASASLTLAEERLCADKHCCDSIPFGILALSPEHQTLCANGTLRSLLKLPSPTNNEILLLDDISKSFETSFNLKEHIRNFQDSKKEKDIIEINFAEKFFRIITAGIDLPERTDKQKGTMLVVEDITIQKNIEQSRDEFFSIASHELRTPLTAISGNASMLIDYYGDKLPDDDARQMVSDILESSKRLIKIVNDFLDVSRLEMGRMQFRNEHFDIIPVITGTLSEVAELANKKNITIAFKNTSGQAVSIDTDPARFKQVIMNLISNAIHYTEKGIIEVGVSEIPSAVKIVFKDTGVGIAKERQGLLFHKFQQASGRSNARESMSTGLGLYISKKLVDHMGGTIQLDESELGVGSSFSVTIPMMSDKQ